MTDSVTSWYIQDTFESIWTTIFNLSNDCQAPKCEHIANVDIFYSNLTCNVIGDLEINKIKFGRQIWQDYQTPFDF